MRASPNRWALTQNSIPDETDAGACGTGAEAVLGALVPARRIEMEWKKQPNGWHTFEVRRGGVTVTGQAAEDGCWAVAIKLSLWDAGSNSVSACGMKAGGLSAAMREAIATVVSAAESLGLIASQLVVSR